MKTVYRRLFSAYGERILREADNFDDVELEKALSKISLSEKQSSEVIDVVYENYHQ